MKSKVLWVAAAAVMIPAIEALAGPAVRVYVGGGNAYCAPFRPTPIVCRPARVLYPTVPIVYQPYGPAYLSPIYYGVGPATATHTSGNSVTSTVVSPVTTVTPLVVPPPVMLNRPVTVYQGTSFTWKH